MLQAAGVNGLEVCELVGGGKVYRIESTELSKVPELSGVEYPPRTHGIIIDGVVMAFTPYSKTALAHLSGGINGDNLKWENVKLSEVS